MNEIKKFEKEGIGVETGKGAGGGRVTWTPNNFQPR